MTPTEVVHFADSERDRLERIPLPASVGELFDIAVSRYERRVAWHSVDEADTLTYSEMALKVDECARGLLRLGVQQNSHVGIMLPNISAFVIAWIALAKIGAVMVPININYQSDELRRLIELGDITSIIIGSEFCHLIEDRILNRVPDDNIVVYGSNQSRFQSWNEMIDRGEKIYIKNLHLGPDKILSIQFTSGSTGMPKGCMLSHGYWTLIGYSRSWHGPAVERILIDMPFHYMGGQWRFLMSLVSGATAVVARRPTIKNMIERLVKYRIDFCSVSPLLAKEPINTQVSRLRLKWASTMALPAILHDSLEEKLGGVPVRETYGMTETGATLAMPFYADSMRGSGMIGLPTAFRECRIVDEDGSDVRNGCVGELWVRGKGLMSGYYKQEDATASVWSRGWLKTGDLFCQDELGFFRLVGRIKDVIRRSGENISPTEVEYTVSDLHGISEVAVIGVPDETRGEEVKIYVVLEEGLSKDSIPPETIIAHCKARLAPFKWPRYISYVDYLPKTASQKTAKAELRTGISDLRLNSFDTIEAVWR